MSIPEISEAIGINRSAVRASLLFFCVLRSRGDSIRLAARKGRLGSGFRGKKRLFTIEWKANISAAKKRLADLTAIGTSIKPNGYLEYTRGENKGRSVHVVIVEKIIGRRLYSNECVHHKDEDKLNNDPENLQLMTRSEHARLHALENINNREREPNGQLK